jgi:geranylgeranyl pyrophosphate synthase
VRAAAVKHRVVQRRYLEYFYSRLRLKAAMHALASLRLHSSSIDQGLAVVQERMLALANFRAPNNADTAGAIGHNHPAEAAAYHLATGGQQIRARLALHAGLSLGMSEPDAVSIAACAELVHNASLVHDDLQDRDLVRRNQPTVWARFGESVAICAGDLLLSAAYAALASFSRAQHLPFMMTLTYERTAAAIAGQCADIASREHTIISMSVYEQIVIAKSGALLSMPLELALIGAGHLQASASVRRATDAFAMGYQILDDLSDFASDAGQHGKPHALNAVRVLQASGHAAAHAQARRLGLQYLTSAAVAAEALPNGVGKLLGEIARKLATPLQVGSC